MPQLGDLLARIALGETLSRGEAEALRLEFNNAQGMTSIARKWAAPSGELDLSFLPIRVLYSKKLSEDTASIDITIPSTINHALVFGNGRGTRNENFDLVYGYFNGDTGANYDSENLFGYGPTAGTTGVTGANAQTALYFGTVPCATSPTSTSGSFFVVASNCQGPLHKTLLSLSGFRSQAAVTYSEIYFNSWRSTERVNKITLYLPNGNWLTGTAMSAVGIV